MNPFLLYHPSTSPTGREVAQAMGIAYGRHFRRTKYYYLFTNLIRWGNVQELPWPICEINSRPSVLLASHKYRSLMQLRAADIPVPRTWRSFSDIWEDEPSAFSGPEIVFGRDFHHTRGKDIEIITADDAIDYMGDNVEPIHEYYVEYVKPHKEYRIHVIGGQIVIAQKKYFSETLLKERAGVDHDILAEEAQYIRNDEHGWRFYEIQDFKNIPAAVANASISSVAALGLDFGAVDVISTGKDKDGKRGACVLEINTAPGMMKENVEIYAKSLLSLLEKKYG